MNQNEMGISSQYEKIETAMQRALEVEPALENLQPDQRLARLFTEMEQ